MGTHVTRYETKDGKTRRAKDTPPAAPGKAETTGTTAAPKTNGADNTHAPGKPAKEGA
ncbi:MAG: hypothetical protein LBK02_07815 [Treponema sp.]|jgi:hypothetical protein|nr:hypothetical protein [Treponema sp.]